MIYEKRIIDPILIVIRDNQEYLIQEENLPQLAKLAYMYNILWYAWRYAWWYDWVLNTFSEEEKKEYNEYWCLYWIEEIYSCEKNPKDKIEMIEPINEKIGKLIYNAWWIHVDNREMISWEDFTNSLTWNVVYSELDRLRALKYKDINQWMKYFELKDKNINNSYIYTVCYLLFSTGTWLKLDEESGYIVDIDGIWKYLYWEKVELTSYLQEIINNILNNEDVKRTIDVYYNAQFENKRKDDEERFIIKKETLNNLIYSIFNKWDWEIPENIKNKLENISNIDEVNELIDICIELNRWKNAWNKDKNNNECIHVVSPISGYSIINSLNEKSDKTLLKWAYDICKYILEHKDSQHPQNVDFANESIDFFKQFI